MRDVLNYYAARPGAAVRAADPGARGDRRHLPRAAGGCRRHRAVELPDAHRVLGIGPGARRGQHGDRQAGAVHAADRAAPGATRAGGRAPARRLPGRAGHGRGGGRATRQAPAGAQDRLHRLHRGGQADHAHVRRPGEAADAGAGRQERQHRLRRRRPGECRGHRADGGVRQLRPGLLLQVPGPGAAQCLRAVHGAARAGRQELRGRRPRRPRLRHGAADLGAAPGEGQLLHRRGDGGGVPRHAPRRAWLLVPAHRARPGRGATAGSGARRSSAR